MVVVVRSFNEKKTISGQRECGNGFLLQGEDKGVTKGVFPLENRNWETIHVISANFIENKIFSWQYSKSEIGI